MIAPNRNTGRKRKLHDTLHKQRREKKIKCTSGEKVKTRIARELKAHP